MNAFKLFYELTDAIYFSLFQAVAVYLLARLIIYLLPWMGASFRYNLLYSSLTLIFLLFIARLISLSVTAPAESPFFRIAAEVNPAMSNEPFSIKAMVLRHAGAIGLIYTLTIVAQILLLLWSLLKIQIFKRKKNWSTPALMQAKVCALQNLMGLKKRVSFYTGEKAAVPFTAGWLKPVIFFPLAALNNLTPEQVEAILIHELAHIKRHDYIFNFFQRIMEIFLFFNPVTWVLATEIRKEREFCCDDVVMKHTGHHLLYAKALFLLAAERTSPLFMTAAGNRGRTSLLTRIKRITDMETMTSNGVPKMVALTGILAFIIFLGWSKPSEALNRRIKKVKAENAAALAGGTAASQIVTVQPLLAAINMAARTDTLIRSDVFNEHTDSAAVPSAPAADIFASRPTPSVPPVPPAPPVSPGPSSSLALPVPPVPPAYKRSMINGGDSIVFDTTGAAAIGRYFNSSEWKEQMAQVRKMSEEVGKQFNSPEWKKQMETIKQQAEEMGRHFKSKEWKSQMEAFKKQSEEMGKMFNSAEWKEQQAELAGKMAALTAGFQSAEWQKQMKDLQYQAKDMSKALQEHFNSAEWKQKMKELQDNAQKMQRKAGKEIAKDKKRSQ